jgi:hypothetical protein
VWSIVRGSENLPIVLGGLTLPPTARMVQSRIEQRHLLPYDYLTVAQVKSGAGVMFAHTMAVSSTGMTFLEGCYHAYTPYNQSFPGLIVSTGTEDYFDSAYYFNAGYYHTDVSGLTHLVQVNSSYVEWSAYRLHEMDPLFFNDGFRFVWRNGDVIDGKTGFKCLTEGVDGDPLAPTNSTVNAYTFIYTW